MTPCPPVAVQALAGRIRSKNAFVSSNVRTRRSRCPALSAQSVRDLVGRLSWDLVSWRGDPRAPRCPMSRHRKDPLRPLTADERQELTRLSRSLSAPAAQVERSRARAGRHGDVVVELTAASLAQSSGWTAPGQHLYDLAHPARGRPELAEKPHLVRDGPRDAPAQARGGACQRSR